MSLKLSAICMATCLAAAPAFANEYLLGGEVPTVTRMGTAAECGSETQIDRENGVQVTRARNTPCSEPDDDAAPRTTIILETTIIVETPERVDFLGDRSFGVRPNSFGVPKRRRY